MASVRRSGLPRPVHTPAQPALEGDRRGAPSSAPSGTAPTSPRQPRFRCLLLPARGRRSVPLPTHPCADRQRQMLHARLRQRLRRTGRKLPAYPARTPQTNGMVKRFKGRIACEVLGITIYSHRAFEQLLRGLNTTDDVRRQRVLDGRTPTKSLPSISKPNPNSPTRRRTDAQALVTPPKHVSS